jgi:hypothetical protein
MRTSTFLCAKCLRKMWSTRFDEQFLKPFHQEDRDNDFGIVSRFGCFWLRARGLLAKRWRFSLANAGTGIDLPVSAVWQSGCDSARLCGSNGPRTRDWDGSYGAVDQVGTRRSSPAFSSGGMPAPLVSNFLLLRHSISLNASPLIFLLRLLPLSRPVSTDTGDSLLAGARLGPLEFGYCWQ